MGMGIGVVDGDSNRAPRQIRIDLLAQLGRMEVVEPQQNPQQLRPQQKQEGKTTRWRMMVRLIAGLLVQAL